MVFRLFAISPLKRLLFSFSLVFSETETVKADAHKTQNEFAIDYIAVHSFSELLRRLLFGAPFLSLFCSHFAISQFQCTFLICQRFVVRFFVLTFFVRFLCAVFFKKNTSHKFVAELKKGSAWFQKFTVNWYFIIKLQCG